MRKYFRSFFIGFAIGMCFFAFLFIYTYNFYKNSNSIFFINSNYNTYLFRNGELILPTKYKYVKLADMPVNLINTLLWSEDRDFYEHYGFNIKSFLRAVVVNAFTLDFSQGGSTITQQLAKMVYLSNEKTIKRKMLDIMLAFFIERSYSKDEILEAYMNNAAYLGNDILGFPAAADRYFKKNINDLSFAEMAVLVGIINGPSIYDPYRHPERARKQAQALLNSLGGSNLKNTVDLKKAAEDLEKMEFKKFTYEDRYVELIYQCISELKELNLKSGGYVIKSTFDKDIFESVTMPATACGIAINNKTGEMLGFWGSQYSVFLSQQQVGSGIKPFYYSMAIENGYTFDTILPDKPTDFGGWKPQNFDKKFRGEVTLKESLVNSINLSSIYLAMHVSTSPANSIQKIEDFLKQNIGIKGKYPGDLTLSLGTLETNPYNMVRAYAMFANYGLIPKIFSVFEVYDRRGNIIFRQNPSIERKVEGISPQTYASMVQLLRETVVSGSAKRANVNGIELVGKTGTAESAAWFTGNTGSTSLSVRVDGKDLLSSTAAVPIAQTIVKSFYYNTPNYKIPIYASVKGLNKLDFFADPITFISKGMDVISYLADAKLSEGIERIGQKIEEVITDIEFIYPDMALKIRQWYAVNSVDFLDDPYTFVLNGSDISAYLEKLDINEEKAIRLMEISQELSSSYPDVSMKINQYLKEKGYVTALREDNHEDQ
ncbi:MAG TPA: transglycosylase domain-containing protein [Petrotogaceae bacterium]|nr:transglycosylase domain-containing protein [Petrotogaceae bacterium]HQF32824.1 transglycosylase domain-containing protein [Petrotogaceae bacterium]HQI78234.1 transglycosylase domain-containing protein [Petrotogaceae bacterium]